MTTAATIFVSSGVALALLFVACAVGEGSSVVIKREGAGIAVVDAPDPPASAPPQGVPK